MPKLPSDPELVETIKSSLRLLDFCKNSTGANEVYELLRLRNITQDHAGYASNVLGVLALFLNFIAVWSIGWLLKLKYLEWKRYYLIMHIALIDVVVAALILVTNNFPHAIFGKYVFEMNIFLHFLEMMAWPLFILVPSMSYLALCAFQYIYVRRPRMYATSVSRNILHLIIGLEFLILLCAGSMQLAQYRSLQSHTVSHLVVIIEGVLRSALLSTLFGGLVGAYAILWLLYKSLPVGQGKGIKNYNIVLGVNVSILILIVGSMLVLDVAWLRFKHSWGDVTFSLDQQNQVITCRHRTILDLLSEAFTIEIAFAIAKPVWLGRMILNPIMNLLGESTIRRALMFQNVTSSLRRRQGRVETGVGEAKMMRRLSYLYSVNGTLPGEHEHLDLLD